MTAPQVDITAPKREEPEEKFFGTLIGVFDNPVPALTGVIRRRPIANAFIVIIVVAIAEGLAQVMSIDSSPLSALVVELEDREDLVRLGQGIIILASPVVGIVVVSIAAGVFWLMSRILGGGAEYGAMFAGIGFASAPYILSSLAGLMTIPLGPAAAVSRLVWIGVVVWTIILFVVVVRESAQFSTERASAAVLIPAAAFAVFAFAAVAAAIVAWAAVAGS